MQAQKVLDQRNGPKDERPREKNYLVKTPISLSDSEFACYPYNNAQRTKAR